MDRSRRDPARGFEAPFRALCGCPESFPWQEALYEEFLEGRIPAECDIPTGLGKTSVIAIWLLALAAHVERGVTTRFPRRLVYVVNRRTVVDQATREAERYREALDAEPALGTVRDAVLSLALDSSGPPLAISTLRGQFADNAEWRSDPSRAAVVVGTVDMIGSRLLFSGYGCGFKSRPLHAGFVGQDALLVHDEAHLEPAFQVLAESVAREQRRCGEPRALRVLALTATPREGGGARFGLTAADRSDGAVNERLHARKGLVVRVLADGQSLVDGVLDRIRAHRESGSSIVVYLRSLEDVALVATALRKKDKLAVQSLTGTMRGLERDRLATEDPIFARFLPRPSVRKADGTVFLVCTSAGEVGVDISADHLVCDLATWDSMAQRLGRVNRFGGGDARVDVVIAPDVWEAEGEPSPYEEALSRTRRLLDDLPLRDDGLRDASPSALGALPMEARAAAFAPAPVVRDATDVLFDAWSLTTVRGTLPGRPFVEGWLHGLRGWEPPETHVAWREEVGRLAGGLWVRYPPEDLLEDFPLKPHELLRDRSDRIAKELGVLAQAGGDHPVWVQRPDGQVGPSTVRALAEGGRSAIAGRTLILPPAAGGLTADGRFSGREKFDEALRYDVSEEWLDADGAPRRTRRWDDERPAGMRLVLRIEIGAGPDANSDDESVRTWSWYVRPRSADDDGSRAAVAKQRLDEHLRLAGDYARRLGERLDLPADQRSAIEIAARCHDLGKHRAVWQRSIGNSRYPADVLAKSDGRRQTDLGNYRHEFGSLRDIAGDEAFRALDADARDLVLHLVAAHHGRARPHFPSIEAFDPARPSAVSDATAAEVPRRFARLQRRYGRWGLAWIESLVRAADALASQSIAEPRNAGAAPPGDAR